MTEYLRADETSWPARQQSVCDEHDNELWGLTEKNHPAVVWWWNQRQVKDLYGACCYVCDKMIVSWARKWPMTLEAKDAVMEHRAEHIKNLEREITEHGKDK
jgi:hypothetical protein